MPKTGKKVHFLICAVPRSGSNMLSSLLNDHPDILCHHELYNPNGIFYALNLRNTKFSFKNINTTIRDLKPLEFLKEVWEHPLRCSHIGFKMTHYQNQCVFDTLLADPTVLKIVLRRKNKIAIHVSKLIAEQRNIWEDYGEKPLKKPDTKVHVLLHDLLQEIQYNKAFYQDIDLRLKKSNQTAFYADYELLSSPKMHEQLLSFLGCKKAPIQAKSRKQNPEPLQELIANYQDLKQQLSESESELLLDLNDS